MTLCAFADLHPRPLCPVAALHMRLETRLQALQSFKVFIILCQDRLQVHEACAARAQRLATRCNHSDTAHCMLAGLTHKSCAAGICVEKKCSNCRTCQGAVNQWSVTEFTLGIPPP